MAYRSPTDASEVTLRHDADLTPYLWVLMGTLMIVGAGGPILVEDILPKTHAVSRERRLLAFPILFAGCLGAVILQWRSLGWRLGDEPDDWLVVLSVAIVALWFVVMLVRWARAASRPDPRT